MTQKDLYFLWCNCDFHHQDRERGIAVFDALAMQLFGVPMQEIVDNVQQDLLGKQPY